MRPGNLLFLLSLSSLVLLHPAAAHCGKHGSHLPCPSRKATIKALCAHTRHPEVCEPSVRSALHATGSIGVKAMLVASMDAATAQTKAVKDKAIKMASDPTLDAMAKKVVEGCPTHYDDAVGCLEDAAKALATGDLDTVKSNIDAYITNVNTCEDDFMDIEELSPMATYDEELTKIGTVVSDFFDELRGVHHPKRQ